MASLGTDDSVRLMRQITKFRAQQLRVVSHPHARYLYDLVRHYNGAVPRTLTYRPAASELARIDESFNASSQGEALQRRDDLAPETHQPMNGVSTPVSAQGKVTSWVSPGAGILWVSAASTHDLGQAGTPRAYRERDISSETWFSPIQHPRLLSDDVHPAPFRVGDVISTSSVPAWGDSGGHVGVVWTTGNTSKVSLYQGSRLLGESADEQFVNADDLSPAPLPYKVVVEGNRDQANRPYSTRTLTEWAFNSSSTNSEARSPLPLIQLDYAVATDLSGKADRRTPLGITPSQFEGATGAGAIHTVRLDVSYDDSATWHTSSLRQSHTTWKASLDAPSKAKFVSLRTSARDVHGNRVSQTLIRAFGIR
ncbi:hypothetical protein [Streptomyces sp. NPDC048643]|uniref:hypothetical protein n=1 Tax=Streptomyces sp. NPDC048643 TaxID=3155637 RepID=UPI00341BC30F